MGALGFDAASTDGVSDAVAKWAAALSSVLALLGTIGAGLLALGGSAERMFREQQLLSLAAVMLLVLGFVLLGLAVVLTPGQSKPSRARRTRFVGASIAVFGIALVIGTLAAGNSAVAQEEPSIQAHLAPGDQLVIEGVVSATGLRSNQRIAVRALGYAVDTGEPVSLFRAFGGPARDGTLSLPLTIPVPDHLYTRVVISAWRNDSPSPDCNEAEANTQTRVACALVQLIPAGYGAAQLHISRDDPGSAISGSISALIRPDARLWLLVLAEGTADPIYEQLLAPDSAGLVEFQMPNVPVPAFGRVCVIAGGSSRPTLGCPPESDPDAAPGSIPLTWVVLPPWPGGS